jgi:UrcA family protein
MMNRYLASLLALLFASLAVSSACFAEPNDGATRLVRYDDLDLATPKGVASLHRRIDYAVNQVCVDSSGPAPGGKVDAICAANARTDARRQVQDAMPAGQVDTLTADRS